MRGAPDGVRAGEDGLLAVGRWFRDRAASSPDRTALDERGATTTYAALDDAAERLAAGLRTGAAGEPLQPGDRVATLTATSGAHVEVLAACAKAGLVLVPLNARLAAPELAWQLDHCQPALLLAGEGSGDAARAAVAACEVARPAVVAMADRASLAADPAGPWGVPDDAPLLLIYTSGTTGRPKGAVLTHASCAWTNLCLDRGLSIGADDVVLQVLPQCHVGGWNVQPLLAWWKGATVVLEPSFDPAAALARIAERGVTQMMGVPATYRFMAADPAFATTDLSSLRRAVVGGAPVDEGLLRTWHDRGVALVQGYGLTEAGPNVLCLPAEHLADRLGWAGRPYPGVAVDLRSPDGGRVRGPGRGELVVRTPGAFAGYWRDPAATEAVLEDGWLRTGDVAERDADGFYRIVDRITDMYVAGGENVYPAEVEAVLLRHPGVAEAAVVGVPDPRWGEAGLAVVVPAAGAQVDPAEVRAFCRQHLAGFKVPRDVRVVDALPRSAVGKVQKGRLRAAAADVVEVAR